MGANEIAVIVFGGVLGLTVGLLLILSPARQAYRRGYNPFVWGLAAVLAHNPLFILVVLAVAPHKGRQRLREEYARELDAKLAKAGRRPPAAGAPRGGVDVSVGDRATEMPAVRSIGDDVTRM